VGLYPAVRALVGNVEHRILYSIGPRDPGKIVFEFYTDIAPTFHPTWAIWAIWQEDILMNGYLSIKISRVVQGDGKPHPDGTEVLKIV
jgi:hypothetical protein